MNSMADARLLRIVTITTFLPAFGLGIAHASISRHPVPAVGLIPLAFSSSFAIFLLSRRYKRFKAAQKLPSSRDDVEEGPSSPSPSEQDALIIPQYDPHTSGDSAHPILVFLTDTILAAALMVVLVFTWLRTGLSDSAELAMLAAYTTIPLLINFTIHLYLALREFAIGLALHDMLRYTAWQTLPPDCPQCGSRLRPDSLPAIPWYESVNAPEVSFPRVSLPSIRAPSMPKVSLPSLSWSVKPPSEWRVIVPAWFRRSREDSEYARLFVDEQGERDGYGGADEDHGHEHAGYRDVVDEEAEAGGSPGAPHEPAVEEVVVGRKDKKVRNTPPILGDDEITWS